MLPNVSSTLFDFDSDPVKEGSTRRGVASSAGAASDWVPWMAVRFNT